MYGSSVFLSVCVSGDRFNKNGVIGGPPNVLVCRTSNLFTFHSHTHFGSASSISFCLFNPNKRNGVHSFELISTMWEIDRWFVYAIRSLLLFLLHINYIVFNISCPNQNAGIQSKLTLQTNWCSDFSISIGVERHSF